MLFVTFPSSTTGCSLGSVILFGFMSGQGSNCGKAVLGVRGGEVALLSGTVVFFLPLSHLISCQMGIHDFMEVQDQGAITFLADKSFKTVFLLKM